MNGECALITPISTSTAQRITLGYRALIKSSTRRRVVYSSASLIVIQDIITPVWDVRLQNYVFRVEKCRSNLSARDSDVLCGLAALED
jgi:hypothetical protein